MIEKLVKTVKKIREAVIHEEKDDGETASSDGQDQDMFEALTAEVDPEVLKKSV